MQKVERKGFTLIEVIMTLGLVALISTLFVLNIDSIFSAGSDKNPQKTLTELVNRAANLALLNGNETKLSFDEENNRLLISDYLTDEVLEYYEFSMEDVEVIFEPVYPEVIDGSASSFNEVEEVDCMRFFPDSTSSKVRITMTYASKEYKLVYDSFSSAIVEDSDD